MDIENKHFKLDYETIAFISQLTIHYFYSYINIMTKIEVDRINIAFLIHMKMFSSIRSIPKQITPWIVIKITTLSPLTSQSKIVINEIK